MGDITLGAQENRTITYAMSHPSMMLPLEKGMEQAENT